jgi:hypothetical protein
MVFMAAYEVSNCIPVPIIAVIFHLLRPEVNAIFLIPRKQIAAGTVVHSGGSRPKAVTQVQI